MINFITVMINFTLKMPRRPKIPRILEDITNIREDFSDIDQGDFYPEIGPADISEDQSEEEVCFLRQQ